LKIRSPLTLQARLRNASAIDARHERDSTVGQEVLPFPDGNEIYKRSRRTSPGRSTRSLSD